MSNPRAVLAADVPINVSPKDIADAAAVVVCEVERCAEDPISRTTMRLELNVS